MIKVLSALEDDHSFDTGNTPELKVAVLPPKEDGITDEDSDGSDDKASGSKQFHPQKFSKKADILALKLKNFWMRPSKNHWMHF